MSWLYWSNKGKHSSFFDKVWEEKVPVLGESTSIIGEAVRCFGRINYDLGNNGGGNMVDEELSDGYYMWDCEDDDERECEYVINEFWLPMFDTLMFWVGKDLVERLKEEVIDMASGVINDAKVIDEVGDALGDRLLKSEDFEVAKEVF
jgi:hypothetical protein